MSVLKTWISLVVVLSLVLIGCGKEPSCTDGIQNQGETGIDCCAPSTTCAVCPVCVLNPEDTITIPDPMTEDGTITAKIGGVDWTSTAISANENAVGFLTFSGLGNGNTLSFVFSGDFAPGTYDYSANIASYTTAAMVDYEVNSALGGNLTFTTFDTTGKTISGTFEFTAINKADDTDTLQITEGVFTDIVYE